MSQYGLTTVGNSIQYNSHQLCSDRLYDIYYYKFGQLDYRFVILNIISKVNNSKVKFIPWLILRVSLKYLLHVCIFGLCVISLLFDFQYVESKLSKKILDQARLQQVELEEEYGAASSSAATSSSSARFA